MPHSIKGRPHRTQKFATGIPGFDELSHGGLPRNRVTLIKGGPGSGKTVFALQCMVNAASSRKQPGIFVAFEESSKQIMADAANFEWDTLSPSSKSIFFMDAQLSPEVVCSGDFDLSGMLAMLKVKKEAMGAQWIVFDGIDVLLTLLQDPIAEMREIYRIRDWLGENALDVAIITAKTDDQIDGNGSLSSGYGFMQFMVDCVIHLDRRLECGVALHRIQISKYRGSDYIAGEFPVSFGPCGVEVDPPESNEIRQVASDERVSAGFDRLDTMLGGGLFRGSSTLITGVPGTSKTTLAAKFAEAACARGERTIFISYDEGVDRIVQNLTSVGIDIAPHIRSGLLKMYSGRTESIGAEQHMIKLKALMREHQPRCMVIDPLSAIAKSGAMSSAKAVANRFIYLAKSAHITVVVTAIACSREPETESTDLQISTIADTWIHLSYLVRNGERNRALTVIKSRGTLHSNQVRELVLSDAGLTLVDVFTAGGEVLMGTMRWEKEDAERMLLVQRRGEFDLKRAALKLAEVDTRSRIAGLEHELEQQRIDLEALASVNEARILSSSDRERELRRIRSADSDAESVRVAAERSENRDNVASDTISTRRNGAAESRRER